MKRIKRYLKAKGKFLPLLMLAAVALAWLLWNRLGSLTGGLSQNEMQVANTPIGWHGMYTNPFFLPLDLLRSIVFFVQPDFGQLLLRWPNTIFGGLAVISFARLVWLWHGTRTAILATALFATSAWTLHVSRFTSYETLYLWAIPTILLIQFELQRGLKRQVWWYLSLTTLSAMLYLPGLIWLVLLSVWLQWRPLRDCWMKFNMPWQRVLAVLSVIIWLPLLVRHLIRPGQLLEWLGLSADFPSLILLGKQFVLVFVNLFVYGPNDPEIWLGRVPLLDIFSLALVLMGIYFYAMHWRSRRSKLLGLTFGLGVILVSLGGAVGLSFLVPVLYMAAATGIAFLLHTWLKTFPLNPLARAVGIGLVCLAVTISCIYNYRAYFIAWPHNLETRATFNQHR